MNIEKAIEIIKQSGYKEVTTVPNELYAKCIDELPKGLRVSINNGTENLIVMYSDKAHAIAPDTKSNESQAIFDTLVSYIQHVEGNEGVDFLDNAEIMFTKEQWAVLSKARVAALNVSER